MRTARTIELLAPARDLATGRVAVDAGADAVYIGGPGFGARRAAGNSLEDIAALVRYARPFGVRVYAALNTLLFDAELAEAEAVARGLIDAGVDALIVQDMGWLRMGLPGTGLSGSPGSGPDCGLGGVEFHASTQTSNIDPADVVFLGRAGFRRVILERALSLAEIRAVRAAVPQDVELEVFIHGAICVGYSGRCFLSRTADPARSGNRGDCSQPCRPSYDLVEECESADGGADNLIIKGRHLLSLRVVDLSARPGELMDAGVGSFKIEGRLKDATYVRNIVSHYRALIDSELARRPGLRRASVGTSAPDFVPDPAKSFTRGGTEYFFDGVRRGVASLDTPKAMGEPLGRVAAVGRDRPGAGWFTLAAARPLAPGDGVCFFADGELRGTNINRVESGRIYPNKNEGVTPGAKIFRNYDHAFVRALERSRMRRRIGVAAYVSAGPSRVEIAFTDETGLRVEVIRKGTFDEARDPDKMAAALRAELARSGDTIFDVRQVAFAADDPCGERPGARFIPVSTLAAMRREGLARLLAERERLVPERCPATEDPAARFPRTRLTAVENVTNRLAERFYRDHGAVEISPALELRGSASVVALPGAASSAAPGPPAEPLMRTRYCIRREIGECLREGSRLRGNLRLERGTMRLRLDFDCEKCEMTIQKT